MRFHFLTGDMNYLTYGGKWISDKCSGDFYFVIEILNWSEVAGRDAPSETYNVSLSVVSPQEAQHVLDSLDMSGEMLETATELGYRDAAIVEALHSYGTYVPVWNKSGNSAKLLLREARQKADLTELGSVMDRPVNAIGTTGWEAIKGNIMAGAQ